MTDVAQILGISASKKDDAAPPPQPPGHQPSRAMKLQGMPREVMGLLSGKQDSQSAELPPVVPSFNPDTGGGGGKKGAAASREGSVKVGSKWISIKKPARKWAWAPFSSSSRTDGTLFRHWVRANVEYPDYPYARFDIHMDPITYSPEEYRRYLASDSWTKSETDQLLELARRFELRWAVIHDRWIEMFHPQSTNSDEMRKIEDLQHRYYSVAALLTQSRISQEAAAEAQALASSTPEVSDDPRAAAEHLLMETAAARALASSDPQHQPLMHNLGAGISNKAFDLTHERERREHMEILWNRTKEEEVEEAELRKELKHVEAQLRKVKKSGGHILAAAAGKALASGASSRNASRSVTPVPGTNELPSAVLDQAFASTAPTPMAQTPYLQSGRLEPPSTGGAGGLNKALLARMDVVLEELKVPTNPLPTKRVCDLYDSVRKDVLALLVLQKTALQKEGLVQSKRLKLAKMGGNVRVVDEETLLGIAPPPPPPPPTAPTVTANRTKATKSSKGKGGGGGGGGAKSASKAKAVDDSNKAEVKEAPGAGKAARKGAGPKRKRKADSKSPRPPSAAAAGGGGAPVAAAATSTAASATAPAAPTLTKSSSAGEPKSSGKKRSRKNA